MIDGLTIRTLEPALLEDYLAFFDHRAFADNPSWASCYCYYHHALQDDKPWETRTAAENRDAVCALIRGRRMHGYLAYMEEQPVGWCHAAPRLEIPHLQMDASLRVEDAAQVGSILCFIVAKPYRRRGIARALLDAVCEGFRQQELSYAEAYPRRDTAEEASNYPGPLALYMAAGFISFRELLDFVIVRKPLA